MDNPKDPVDEKDPCNFSFDWLQKEVSAAEVDAKYAAYGSRVNPVALHRWHEMRAKILDGDALWEYNAPRDCWRKYMGRAGYVLIRDGAVVDDLMTKMN